MSSGSWYSRQVLDILLPAEVLQVAQVGDELGAVEELLRGEMVEVEGV